MPKLKIFYFVIFFCALIGRAFAQEQGYNFLNLDSKEGLSSNIVNVILKDRYGYMWFGTDDGLNRFDGKQFTAYRHSDGDNNSIVSNMIVALYEDKNGNLWIGTGMGFSMYDRKLDSFINIGLPVLSICNGPDDNLWLGTYGGLFTLDVKTMKFAPFQTKRSADHVVASHPFPCMFKDKAGRIWMGNKGGLYEFQPETSSFKQYKHTDTDPGSLADNSVTSIAQDRKGNIWIGTDNGVSMLMPGTDKFKNYRSLPGDNHSLSNNIVYSVASDPGGNIWIGTEDGLNILDPSTGNVQRVKWDPRNKYSLVGKAVKCVFIDRDNISWVGTYRGGINKYDKNLTFFNLRQSNPFDPQGLSAQVVTSFARADDTGIYVGTDGGGLNFFNFKTGLFKHVPLLGTNTGRSILAMEGAGQEIWVGTYLQGLFIYNAKTNQCRQVTQGKGTGNISGNDIFCIRRDSKGDIWIGTNGQGVNKWDASTKTFQRFGKDETGTHFIPINGFIRAIEEDHKGNIVIGTSGDGVAIYNPSNGRSQILNTRNSKLPHNTVNTLCVTADGTIWVGMSEGGLSYYDEAKKHFVSYSEKDGLANEVIYKILEDRDGKIWVSTNKGISSFDRKLKKFSNYTHYNGLQRSPFVLGAGLKQPDGTLFFGGTDGFNYFNPANLHFNQNVPRVVFTQLRISNKVVMPSKDAEIKEQISIAKEIELDYRQNFSLSFAALNFTSPHESRYFYKLDKFDKDWSSLGATNTVSYTNLDPGKYTFYVKAASENGSWTSPTTSIVVYVRPPFWRTYYAYFLYILIAVTALFYIRYRGITKLKAKFALEQERMVMRQALEQERLEGERLHEFDQLKIKFLTNLSHEFRTPISLIMGPVEQLLQVETSPAKAGQLGLIRRNSRRLLNLVNQLLDFRNMEEKELRLNPTVGDFIAFARDVADSFRDLSERKQINFEFHSPLNAYFTSFDHEKIERIFFNLLSNAFKFTLKGGTVSLRIDKEGSGTGLRIRLIDTGIGIAEEEQEKIFDRFFQSDVNSAILNQGNGIGLSLTKEFVKMHAGTISVESIAGRGTTFTIHFPFDCVDSAYIAEGEPNENLQQPEENAAVGKSVAEVAYAQLPSILIVEDNDDFRFYLKENLKTSYRVEEAADGKEGWQKVLFSHPQLVVSDISIPYMSGIDLCRKIKSDKRTSHIPVLLLTALTGEENQLQGLETGANDYMSKPFNIDILNVKIRNLLELNARLKTTYSKQINLLAPDVKIESANEKLLGKVIQYIEENLTNPQLSVEDLSRKLTMSRGSLYTKILELTGKTPVEFIRSIKLEKAIVLLEKSDMNVSQVSYAVGFSTPNYFARAFKAQFNMLPTEYIHQKRENKVYKV